MKILIAVPTFENICAETFRSIYNLQKGKHEVGFEFVKGYDCARARNEIAKLTIERGYDAVLMVDSDIILPEDALINLTEPERGIVLGCYPHKGTKTHEVELFRLKQANFKERYTYDTLPKVPRIIVKGGGFGCAFVKTKMFERLEYPWFKYVTKDNGAFLSEDLYFCTSAVGINLHIEADTRVRCGHQQKYFQYE